MTTARGGTQRLFEEALIEFWPHGQSVRVTAMDPASLTEVAIVGPATASEEQLRLLALKKLSYVLEKQRQKRRNADDDRGGWLV